MAMDAAPMQPPDGGGALGALSRLLGRLEDGLNVVAAITIFVVMLGTTFQIFTRIAGFPVPGYLEASEQAIAIFAFLGVAYAQRLGAHIRMELFVGGVGGRARWAMEAVTTFLALCVIGTLIPFSYAFFENAFYIGDTTYDYGIPTWPSKLLVPIAFGVWFLRLLLEFAGFVRLLAHPDADPVAVPIIKSAADVAHDEMTETFGRDAGVGLDQDEESGR